MPAFQIFNLTVTLFPRHLLERDAEYKLVGMPDCMTLFTKYSSVGCLLVGIALTISQPMVSDPQQPAAHRESAVRFKSQDGTFAPARSQTPRRWSAAPMAPFLRSDAGNQLQLVDATMRAQFNQTGASDFHLILHPNVLPAVTINVPSRVPLESGRGVVFADVGITWWSAQIQNLETQADPTHLPIYLTNNVLLHIGPNVLNCCVIGFHGTRAAGFGGGSSNSNGNAKVQTFAWASWVQPGIYARPNGGTDWALPRAQS